MTDHTWTRLAFALAGSGAVHAALISAGDVALPEKPADRPPLTLRIEHVAPPQKPVTVQRPRVARTPPAVVVASAPSAPIVAPPSDTPAAVPGVVNAPEPAVAEAPEPAAPEPTLVAKAEPSTLTTERRPLRTLPRRGEITYALVYGRDRFPVGRTVQSWQIDGTQYRLASNFETTGLVDLFRSQHRTYVSRGVLTPDGLKPETFVMSRNRSGRGSEESRVEFEWAAGTLLLGSLAEPRREPLPRGSQDIVSLAFQLALDPPQPGRIRLPVTNGNKFEVYELDVLPEESIETPLGVLRSLPIRQVRKAGEESVEIWLASEYRYLPVRIRFINRDGQPGGEQIVREIRLSED